MKKLWSATALIPSAKVVLRHAMLDCFREFSYQNKWLVSLNYLPQPMLDSICTTDQYPSDYITFSSDGYTLQISNERLANIIEELPQPEQRLLILCFILELNDREIGRRMCCSSAIQRRHTSVLLNLRKQLTGNCYEKVKRQIQPPPSLSVIKAARAGRPMRWNRFCSTMMLISTNCVCER